MKVLKKSKLKGMTLMEIIVAIAVLVIISTMMVIAAISAVSNIRTAKKVSDKNAVQSPYAASHVDGVSDGQMSIQLSGAGGSGVMNVEKYHVDEGSGADDRSGDYRYFEYTPVTVTTAPAGP